MSQAKTGKYLLRGLVYISGFLVFSLGTALSIKSTLGVTAVTALPLSLSTVTGFSVGQMMCLMAVVYVGLQAALLRKQFKPLAIGQVAIGLLMGFLVDLFCQSLAFYVPQAYYEKLILTAVSLPIIALGLSLIINANFLPSPSEGFSLTLAGKIHKPFPSTKRLTDCITLAVAVLLPLVFSCPIVGIREGTLINALSIGPFIGLYNRLLKRFYAFMHGTSAPASAPALKRRGEKAG